MNNNTAITLSAILSAFMQHKNMKVNSYNLLSIGVYIGKKQNPVAYAQQGFE